MSKIVSVNLYKSLKRHSNRLSWDILKEDYQELKDDIEKFRDLETEYASKIVEAKREMALTVKNDMSTLVETLNVGSSECAALINFIRAIAAMLGSNTTFH